MSEEKIERAARLIFRLAGRKLTRRQARVFFRAAEKRRKKESAQ